MSFGISAGSAALIGGGLSLASGLIGSSASSKAGQQQADASNNATTAQLQMFNTQNDQQAPYRQSGTNSLNNLNYLLGYGYSPNVTTDSTLADNIGMGNGSLMKPFSADDLKTNLAPNYQFMLNQGLGATANAANLQTGFSGNTLKGLTDYAENYAGNAYQNAFNNYNTNQTNIFNRLSSIAGLGQTANASTANLAGSIAPGVANTMVGAGAAQAAGTVGSANALSGAGNNAMGWYTLNNLMNPNSGGAGAGTGQGPG